MKIIADTATLIPPTEGSSQGLTVIPVSVAIDGHTYQDYTQISDVWNAHNKNLCLVVKIMGFLQIL